MFDSVTAWLQESADDANPPSKSFPRLQRKSEGWVEPVMAHPDAWRELWKLVRQGFYLTAATGMQHLEEAGVQTLLATVFVGFPALLGGGVELSRGERVDRGHDDSSHPVDFTFRSGAGVVTLVVEAVTPLVMESEYSESAERLFAAMYAAREHNQKEMTPSSLSTGMIVDGVGAVMFQLSTDASGKGSIACSEYMPLFDTSINPKGGPTPGSALELWLQRTLASVLPECGAWNPSAWQDRALSVTNDQVAWSEKFTRIVDAMRS
jgi:hypothetical protein